MDIEQVEVNPLKRAILPNATKIIHGIFSFLLYNPTDSIIIPIIVWVILIIL